jgi:2-polyprenyl-3-methyl-5-hydroxy-6-metoxy-1,4-benzoquinol methylase
LPRRQGDEITTIEHWDNVWCSLPPGHLPPGLNVAVRNLRRLLRAHVKEGMRFLEIGCAPGSMLAWVAEVLRAQVAGLDYSEPGLALTRRLFEALGLEADLRCEDLFNTTFEPASFDVVFSAGVIEHFDDPYEVVRRHMILLKRGGKALITIPNYGGLYGHLQRHFDPDNLALHNLTIMQTAELEKVAPMNLVGSAHAYPAGRISPGLVSLGRLWPRPFARIAAHVINALGLIQPADIASLCPMLVLELCHK